MEYKNIDKEIYHLPEIRKHLRTLLWAWICVALGAVAAYFNFTISNLSDISSSLLLGVAAWGVCCLVMVLCYYAFGDSRAPYHTTEKLLLERSYNYYSLREKENIIKAVEEKDLDAISKIKGNAMPEIELVGYSDEKENLFYYQVKDGYTHKPLTDIVKIKGSSINSTL